MAKEVAEIRDFDIRDKKLVDATAQSTIESTDAIEMKTTDGNQVFIDKASFIKAVGQAFTASDPKTFTKLLGMNGDGPMGIGASDLASVLGVNDLWTFLLGNINQIEYLGIKSCDVGLPFYPSTNYKYYWKVSFNTIEDWNYLFNNGGKLGNFFIFGGTETNRNPQLHIKGNYTVGNISLQTNTLYECSLTRESNSIVQKYNNTISNTLSYVDFTSPSKLHINGQDCKFYYLRVYDGNDNLIYDFIPARVGQVGCLYDRVSDKFITSKGKFVLGPDL